MRKIQTARATAQNTQDSLSSSIGPAWVGGVRVLTGPLLKPAQGPKYFIFSLQHNTWVFLRLS